MSSFRGTETFGGALNLDANTLVVDAKNSRVGIGTATPSQALDVTGNTNVTGNSVITGNLTVDTNTLITDATNNRVGVGISAPNYTLDVYANNPTRGIVSQVTNSAAATLTGAQLTFLQNTINWWTIGQPAATDAFAIWSNRHSGADGIERMRIDSSGRATIPSQPAFHAYRDAGNIVGNAAGVDIIYNQVVYNNGGHYNSVNGIFTAPVAGKYFFSAFGMSNVTATFWLQLYRNGALHSTGVNPYETGGATYNSVSFAIIANLAANDQIKVRTGPDATIGMYAIGNAHNAFCGYLLG